MQKFQNCSITKLQYAYGYLILIIGFVNINPEDIYLFKVDNGNTKTVCEICLKLRRKVPEHNGLFIVNFEQILYMVLLFSLLIFNKPNHAEVHINFYWWK